MITKYYKLLNEATGVYRRIRGWRVEEPVMYKKINSSGEILFQEQRIQVNEWIPPGGIEITEQEYNTIKEDHPVNDKLRRFKPSVERKFTDAVEEAAHRRKVK